MSSSEDRWFWEIVTDWERNQSPIEGLFLLADCEVGPPLPLMVESIDESRELIMFRRRDTDELADALSFRGAVVRLGSFAKIEAGRIRRVVKVAWDDDNAESRGFDRASFTELSKFSERVN